MIECAGWYQRLAKRVVQKLKALSSGISFQEINREELMAGWKSCFTCFSLSSPGATQELLGNLTFSDHMLPGEINSSTFHYFPIYIIFPFEAFGHSGRVFHESFTKTVLLWGLSFSSAFMFRITVAPFLPQPLLEFNTTC